MESKRGTKPLWWVEKGFEKYSDETQQIRSRIRDGSFKDIQYLGVMATKSRLGHDFSG